ncbi:MAG: hypothetical protein JW797_03375 [Bradymonadales bacterium]|nr:hypothetical protein [Bradymonadales bacterium]
MNTIPTANSTAIQSTDRAIQTREQQSRPRRSIRAEGAFGRLLERLGTPAQVQRPPSTRPQKPVDLPDLSCWRFPDGGQADTRSDLERLRDIQSESEVINLELIELQQSVQAENCRFTTLSNLLEARYQTAKAAINNIRV